MDADDEERIEGGQAHRRRAHRPQEHPGAGRFSKLPKVNSNGNVADGYKYSISYGGDEVVAEDGAVPTALQPVITTLNGLLSK